MLALRDILVSEDILITKVHAIMVKLRGLLLSAKLQKLTQLGAKLNNRTRWSSSIEMLQRYTKIRQHLSALEDDVIDAMCLTNSENRRIDVLLKKLDPLESVTKSLQHEGRTVSEVRILFDAVIENYSGTATRLFSSAEIVHSPEFESAVVKLQQGNTLALSREEEISITRLLIENSNENITECDGLSFAQRVLKRRKMSSNAMSKKYLDTRFLVPTSNVCERLFSQVGYVLTDRRKAINPANLESQIYLHANRDLWGSQEVNEIL